MAISPDGIIGNAVEAVTSQLAILNNTAGQYRGELSAALAQIAAVQVKDVADLPAFLPPDLPVPENPLADIPQYQPESLQFGAEPEDINIDGLLEGLDVSDLEGIPDAPVAIPVTIPESPAMAAVSAPERPSVDTNIAIPDAPAIDVPSMDALEQIHIPEFSFPELPTFDAAPPAGNVATCSGSKNEPPMPPTSEPASRVAPPARAPTSSSVWRVRRIKAVAASSTGTPNPIWSNSSGFCARSPATCRPCLQF